MITSLDFFGSFYVKIKRTKKKEERIIFIGRIACFASVSLDKRIKHVLQPLLKGSFMSRYLRSMHYDR